MPWESNFSVCNRSLTGLGKVIGVHENILCHLKADSTLGVRHQSPTLTSLNVEATNPSLRRGAYDHDRPKCPSGWL
jgi:hypothetical protein